MLRLRPGLRHIYALQKRHIKPGRYTTKKETELKKNIFIIVFISLGILIIYIALFPLLFSVGYSVENYKLVFENYNLLRTFSYPIVWLIYQIKDLFSEYGLTDSILGLIIPLLIIAGMVCGIIFFIKGKKKILWGSVYGLSFALYILIGQVFVALSYGH